MQRLAHAIYNFDRATFDGLIEAIVLKSDQQMMHHEYHEGFTEFSNSTRTTQHRVYLLFTPEDLEETAKQAAENAWVNDIHIYAQEGYEPSLRELKELEQRGISIAHANVRDIALSALNLDLATWVADAVQPNDSKTGQSIYECLCGSTAQHSPLDAATYLLQHLSVTDFTEVTLQILARKGCAIQKLQGNHRGLYSGSDGNGVPILCCVHASPSAADFEAFYQTAVAMQSAQPKLSAYFCHQGDDDPNYEVRDAARDPDNQHGFGCIEALSPRRIAALGEPTAWLRRWLVHRLGTSQVAFD